MSLYDGNKPAPRFNFQQHSPVACLSWKPTFTVRLSKSPYNPTNLVKTEDLVVSDEMGNILCFVVEWPERWDIERTGWMGIVTHIATISIHTQQICGLAWSVNGEYLASGGNDNLCCVFDSNDILDPNSEGDHEFASYMASTYLLQRLNPQNSVRIIRDGAQKHGWLHGAAVKAIAFCPWLPSLIATGGGSNDKCIHFYHVTSGACLATIHVAGQVTSLIWSTTRREIVATFGYALPEHPFRIAVFSWPDCVQVAAIPWEGDHRALYAISYPGGPNESEAKGNKEGGGAGSRTAREGCIVVAASDESVKFHEVWADSAKNTIGSGGILRSDILEALEGIDKEGDIIR